jgi:hypothetical protein
VYALDKKALSIYLTLHLPNDYILAILKLKLSGNPQRILVSQEIIPDSYADGEEEMKQIPEYLKINYRIIRHRIKNGKGKNFITNWRNFLLKEMIWI